MNILNKKITFYESIDDFLRVKESAGVNSFVHRSRYVTQLSIKDGIEDIHTVDLSSLSFDLLDSGYRIFLKQKNKRCIELKVGNNDWTNKEIRYAHNLLRLFIGGAMSGAEDEESGGE